MKLVTRIFVGKRYITVNPDRAPVSSRELRSFLIYNGAPTCFFKDGGAWYKITEDCKALYVSRTLYLLSFKQWLDIALNDNFIATMPN